MLKTKIITPRVAETRDFYVGCLGMRVVEEWADENDVGCILALREDAAEALLEINECSEPHDFSGLSLQFQTDYLARYRASLPAGTEFRGPVKRPWGSTYLYLTDPNGISVIVFEDEI